MSERFDNLKKIPDEPAARMLSAKATKLDTPVEAPASARVEVVLSELAEKGGWVDILRLLSVALPEREAVWWACIAARDLTGEEATPCLKAAEAWVFGPNDKNREAVQVALDAADMDDDTTLAATAALYAPGTLGVGEMAELAAPPSAVSACAFGMNMVAVGEAEDPLLHMHWLIDRAVDIARGGNGKVDVPAIDTSPAPLSDDEDDLQEEES
ncbi:hypothetical protein OB2597_13478 [Pseudooceanicola batsensis HTCC2597]|uniref:Uncharacterized protein n=1 Tax=Pseudooceanicola batsensis (strain ATCC BAA-863 / DSM 15984 / KCTC 12145 / HTCC2597) TaxID=252305 RepID=A3TYC4_PSEBH|nr:hypothetical protein [Pseudooceanicola batsensis]EAQ03158.1 hypothetical protein OB2597_13478 [Pseudooceanicola batsensis HTCC2597]